MLRATGLCLLGLVLLALPVGPAGSAASPAPREVAAWHGVQARLFYDTPKYGAKLHIRLEIRRHGARLLDWAVPPGKPGTALVTDVGGYGDRAVSVRDLDGDGEPEVLLNLNTEGAHCCRGPASTASSRAPAAMPSPAPVSDAAAEPAIRDSNGDGRPEFVSTDDRFEYVECAGYACSGVPVRIWSYRAGRFLNVTRRFPGRIGADAAWYLRAVERSGPGRRSARSRGSVGRRRGPARPRRPCTRAAPAVGARGQAPWQLLRRVPGRPDRDGVRRLPLALPAQARLPGLNRLRPLLPRRPLHRIAACRPAIRAAV